MLVRRDPVAEVLATSHVNARIANVKAVDTARPWNRWTLHFATFFAFFSNSRMALWITTLRVSLRDAAYLSKSFSSASSIEMEQIFLGVMGMNIPRPEVD